MKVVLTNLSDHLYIESQNRLNASALKFGISEIVSYNFNDIKGTKFYIQNKKILDQPNGLGYWLWKPYIISETLESIDKDDLLIYSDCGIEIISDLQPLIDIALQKEPVLLFANGDYINAQWTKRDCFILMDCDHPDYHQAAHCDAAFLVFRKCQTSIRFIEEWLEFAKNERILTDVKNACGKENLIQFKGHRRDQSILSLLAKKYQIELYRMPSQFGNHYKSSEFQIQNELNYINQSSRNSLNYYSDAAFLNSPYYQLLNHHRTKLTDLAKPISIKKNNFVFLDGIKSLAEKILKHQKSQQRLDT